MEDFSQLKLDNRLINAIHNLGIKKPTPVQENVIPFALDGKDIFAQASTGSGKTLAFLLPILHKMLPKEQSKENEKLDKNPSMNQTRNLEMQQGKGKETLSSSISISSSTSTSISSINPSQSSSLKCIILVPTKDLAQQIFTVIESLKLQKFVRALNLSADMASSLIDTIKPNIIISTPSKLVDLAEGNALDLNSIEFLVVDEADLVFGFGYGKEMEQILPFLPKYIQCFLMSASLTDDIKTLKQLYLHNAVVIRVEDERDQKKLFQYYIECATFEDKFLLIYVVLKLNLLQGKMIIFCNNTSQSYRLKLFLERFSIKACVLNGELPIISRYHIIEEFNRGVYDIVIASDQSIILIGKERQKKRENKGKRNGKMQNNKNGKNGKNKEIGGNKEIELKNQIENDENGINENNKETELKEFSAARGVDFKRVDVVINFDFPEKPADYIHRVGRTARAGLTGTGLSLISPVEKKFLEKYKLTWPDLEIEKYNFDSSQIEGFRYRAQDVFYSINKTMIQEAQLEDVKNEILASEKLANYFKENPEEKEILLHHGKPLSKNVCKDLKTVPKYLLDGISKQSPLTFCSSLNSIDSSLPIPPSSTSHSTTSLSSETCNGKKELFRLPQNILSNSSNFSSLDSQSKKCKKKSKITDNEKSNPEVKNESKSKKIKLN